MPLKWHKLHNSGLFFLNMTLKSQILARYDQNKNGFVANTLKVMESLKIWGKKKRLSF